MELNHYVDEDCSSGDSYEESYMTDVFKPKGASAGMGP